MKLKLKINRMRNIFFALMLCMGVFILPMTVQAGGNEGDDTEVEAVPVSAVDIADIVQKKPLTPDGQATVTDHVTSEDDKEFYTFTTPEGNVFYLVIDNQRNSDNVYFLNAVTEADLYALAEKEKEEGSGAGDGATESAVPDVPECICEEKCAAGMVDTSCPVCKDNLKACIGEKSEAEEAGKGTGQEKESKQSSTGLILVILIAVAVVGGIGYYLKIYKPQHDLDDADDLDDLLDDGPEIDEDEPETPDNPESDWIDLDNEQDPETGGYDDYPDDYYDEDAEQGE